MAKGQDTSEEQGRLAEIAAMDLEAARPTFERICRLAQALVHAPLVHIAIVQADTLWLAGLSDEALPVVAREHAFSNVVLESGEPVWVEDMSIDERYRQNPFVTGPYRFRFYAAAPISLSNGRCIGILSVVDRKPRPFDATAAATLADFAALAADDWERRRSLRAVVERESEAQAANDVLGAIIESAPVALAMTDADLNIIRASARWREKATRWTTADMSGLPISQVAGNDVTWRAVRDQCKAGHRLKNDRARFDAPDGVSRWVNWEVTPWTDAKGEFGGLLVLVNEITDVVEALEKSERAEQRLKLAAEMADINVWELDFRRQDVSYAGAEVYPVYDNDFARVSDTIWDLIHPADRPAAEAEWDQHLETGKPYKVVVRLMRPNAPHLWVRIAAEAIKGADGEVEKVIGATQNVDREKRAERAMARALDAAEAANRAKGEFLANMSHEIRTPLNGVMGAAGALARTGLEPDQRDMVRLIESSASLLDSLLGDVLDIERIESGRLELAKEPFELGAAVREVAALFEPKAREKGLSFDVETAPTAEAIVAGDVVRLKQIVSNLLSNAVKFTDQGAVVVEVEATRSVEQVNVKLSVRDTGIGFDAEVGAQLFQRFQQADGSITRRFGGSGLGLAISRSLVDAMGGTLEAASQPGVGSTFTLKLTLPRARGAIDQAEPALDVETARIEHGPKVLLAEDHPTNRKVVTLILESVGVELTVVENGQEAVDAAARQDFDAILMDMQMPVMDGLTAVRLIRQHERETGARRTPILALTANALPEHAQASIDAGADGHLSKPISAAKLVEAVRAASESAGPTPAQARGVA